jgi:hypothetical protein
MKIEAGKFYETRNGRKARIYAVDAGGDYPIHGAILFDNGTWAATEFTPDGADCKTCRNMPSDIIAELTDAPDIRWDVIPDVVDIVSVSLSTVHFTSEHNSNRGASFTTDDWLGIFFPNLRDFTGQTFTRPKA